MHGMYLYVLRKYFTLFSSVILFERVRCFWCTLLIVVERKLSKISNTTILYIY